MALLWGKEIQSGDFGALAKIAEAFCKTAQQERYEVVVKRMAEEGFRLNDYLADHHFYGAFLLELNFFSPVYAPLKKMRYLLVLPDNYLTDNERIAGIGSENILSTEYAVDYLVSLGHKKIAFLDGERQSFVSAERLAGYILGLSKNSIEYRCELIYFGDFPAARAATRRSIFTVKISPRRSAHPILWRRGLSTDCASTAGASPRIFPSSASTIWKFSAFPLTGSPLCVRISIKSEKKRSAF